MAETSPKVAPSLLDELVIGPVPAAFTIGMDEWLDPQTLGHVYPERARTTAAKQSHPTTAAKQLRPTMHRCC